LDFKLDKQDDNVFDLPFGTWWQFLGQFMRQFIGQYL
jgi:hypothetical protein